MTGFGPAGAPPAGPAGGAPSGAPPRAGLWRQDDAGILRTLVARLTDPARVRLVRVDGPTYRAVFLRHLRPPKARRARRGWVARPLYAQGSLGGARYTPRTPDPGADPPAGLYLSLDPTTPPTELRTVVYGPGGAPTTVAMPPFVTLSVDTHVDRVLDLTDPGVCGALDLQPADLHGNWVQEEQAYLAGAGPMPATQMVGLAAHATGVVAGVLYAATRTPRPARNLVVFPNRLIGAAVLPPRAVPDRLVVHDPDDEYGDQGRLP